MVDSCQKIFVYSSLCRQVVIDMDTGKHILDTPVENVTVIITADPGTAVSIVSRLLMQSGFCFYDRCSEYLSEIRFVTIKLLNLDLIWLGNLWFGPSAVSTQKQSNTTPICCFLSDCKI